MSTDPFDGFTEEEKQITGDITAVAAFIAWHEPREMFGGFRAEEAWEAFCRLLDLPSAELREAVKGKDE